MNTTPITGTAPNGTAVPTLRTAVFAPAGTDAPPRGTDDARTAAAGTAGTGTGRQPRDRWPLRVLRTGRHRPGTSGTDTAPTSNGHTGTSPGGTGTSPAAPAVPDPREVAVQAARTEAALRGAARAAGPTGTAATRRRSGTADLPHLPMPEWVRSVGTWVGFLFGEMPLLAPMLVSGYYTFHVGTDALGLHWSFALCLVGALEGGAYKLAILYRKRLVDGIGTIAERLGLLVVVAAIGALIYWHATLNAEVKPAAPGEETGFADVVSAADWRPALVAACMAAFGVFINGRQARWNHREELRRTGRLDMQALRIGVWQWIVSPWESAWSFRHGMRYRISSPAEAVRDWNLWKAAGKPALWPPSVADIAGTAGTAPAEVPQWLLDTLFAATGTTQTAGIASNGAGRTGTRTGNAAGGTGAGTGTSGTSGTGTGSTGAGGTAAGTSDRGTGSDTDDTAGTGPAGTAISDHEIAAWRERHRERLIAVRKNLRGKTDPEADWTSMAEDEMPLSAICTAGGFGNKTYAKEIKAVLLHDRQEMDSLAAMAAPPTAAAAG